MKSIYRYSSLLLLACQSLTSPGQAAQAQSGQAQSGQTQAAPALAAQDGTAAAAQPAPEPSSKPTGIAATYQDLAQQLETSLSELTALRTAIEQDLVGLGKEQSQLEQELSAARAAFRSASLDYDNRSLQLTTLSSETKTLEATSSYLGNLLGEYTRNFESRLLLPEQRRHVVVLEAAKLAPQNSNLTQAQIFEAQIGLLSTSLGRIEEAFGGLRFEGQAIDQRGQVLSGNFVLVGPLALFQAADGRLVGTAEEALNSSQPRLVEFVNPLLTETASRLTEGQSGHFVFDPTLGNARKVEETNETLVEHLIAGGPVMVPILLLAAVALLMALYKWGQLAFQGRPSRKRIDALMDAVEAGDETEALQAAKSVKGPVGKMLRAGVEYLDKPKELIEEAMFERVLKTKLELNSLLPFIGVAASSAPLLGLLGTVTGIIDTFKMITVVGSGDVKTLSGGISEALITTEYGLIVAIPALLIHAMLNRKARGIISGMEIQAVNFMNQVGKARSLAEPAQGPVLHAPHLVPHASQGAVQPMIGPGQIETMVQNMVQAKVREALASYLVNPGVGASKN